MVHVSATGREEVQKDIDRLGEEALQRFSAQARWLAVMPIAEWHEPQAKKLKGFTELYEIRFKANGVQLRPLGFFSPQAGTFTIVLWASHKQDVYKPSSALQTANTRIKDIREGRATTAPLQIDGEDFQQDA